MIHWKEIYLQKFRLLRIYIITSNSLFVKESLLILLILILFKFSTFNPWPTKNASSSLISLRYTNIV